VILEIITGRRKCDKIPGFININAVFKNITDLGACVVGHVLISIYNYCSDVTGRTKWENGSEEGNYGQLDSGLSKGKLDDTNYIPYILESILYSTVI
jgi:hypothetical protein